MYPLKPSAPTVPCRCVIGVTVLHTILYFMFVSETGGSGYVHAAEVPMLMVSCLVLLLRVMMPCDVSLS